MLCLLVWCIIEFKIVDIKYWFKLVIICLNLFFGLEIMIFDIKYNYVWNEILLFY